MDLIQKNILLIVGILLVLVIIEGLIIYVQWGKTIKKHKGGSSGSRYKEKIEKVREERDEYRSKAEQLKKDLKTLEKEYGLLKSKYLRSSEDYGKEIVENKKLILVIEDLNNKKLDLEKTVRELTSKNDELNKSVGKEPAPYAPETVSTVILTPTVPKSESKEVPTENEATRHLQSSVQDVAKKEVVQDREEMETETPKEEPKFEPAMEKTMYASFPRSAGSSIYFSDLSENRVEDSYFELKISIASGKATFRPLDFMKIRNYDPAMAAMRTEGVKPNVASTVQGIAHGNAHIEGNDWIIDNPAIIKLA